MSIRSLAALAAALAIAALPLPSLAQAGTDCIAPTPQQLAPIRRAVERNLMPKSRAVEHVHTEGTLPHQGIWDQSVEAEKDWQLMRQLAQLWQAECRP